MFAKTLVALSFAALSLADSQEFGLLVIRSGSQYQYASIVDTDSTLQVGSSNAVDGVITDDGLFKLSDGSYVVIGSDSITVGSSKASNKFSISSGYLTYDDSQAFSIDSTSGHLLYKSQTGTGIGLRATAKSGSAVPDFKPSHSSNSTTSASSNSTTSAFSNSTTSSTLSTHTTSSGNVTTPSVSTATGGANAYQAGAGIAAVGAAVALLL
ncbi:hypothetical protein WICMUC_003390 [Wickerhamomyces mucosus]|uniref:Cell wall protein CWP1 n=1 Tax=Wickerhamomyces mucosus TaxID=1378264 RepID=A0A9P8PLE8_9ASCO|nr:hypothetical protein WICMUC_003390 [Wickerhamomyces mucosus]